MGATATLRFFGVSNNPLWAISSEHHSPLPLECHRILGKSWSLSWYASILPSKVDRADILTLIPTPLSPQNPKIKRKLLGLNRLDASCNGKFQCSRRRYSHPAVLHKSARVKGPRVSDQSSGPCLSSGLRGRPVCVSILTDAIPEIVSDSSKNV